MAIRVLLADDHAIVRQGVRAVIESEPGLTVVGEASSGAVAVELVVRRRADVALLDLRMPGMGGIEATQLIRVHAPSVRVLILTTYADEDEVRLAEAAGASGVIMKGVNGSSLVRSVRAVHQEALSHGSDTPDLRARMPGQAKKPAPGALAALSEPERRLLLLLGSGLTVRAAARELFISQSTAFLHIAHICSAWGVADASAALTKAVEEGLLH